MPILSEAEPNQEILPVVDPVVDSYLYMEQLLEEQNIDVTELVVEAHAIFANDEPYNDLAPHENDRWHNFLNFGIRVLENTKSSGDRNQDVSAMLGCFVTHYSQL